MNNLQLAVPPPFLTTDTWHGGDPARARQSLLAAFDVGQLLSQFVWHLGQAVALVGDEQLLEKAVCELSGKALEMAPTLEAGVRLREAAVGCLNDWQGVRASEGLAEDLDSALRALQERPDDPGAALEAMQCRVAAFERSLRLPLQSETASIPELWAALLLGECIDQGLRPPGVLRHVFREEENAAWWRAVRLDPTLRAPVKPFAPPPAGRALPPRTELVRRARLPGELLPPAGWAETIRGYWHWLGLEAELPNTLFLLPSRLLLPSRPGFLALPGVVSRVRSAAGEGLARLAERLTGGTRDDATLPPGPGPAPVPAGAGPDDSAAAAPACLGPACSEAVSAEEFDRLLAIKKEVDKKGEYIGESLPILRMFETIVLLNRTPDKPVLALGPSGAGKTQIARLIHEHSGRGGKPFVEEQASDFHGADFRITKGRWAGYGTRSGLADLREGTPGRLREAAGGTIFVDELAEVPLEAQTFLLRVLDGKDIPPAAGVGPGLRPGVRLIFATNVEPEVAVEKGKLRDDLWRRLLGWTVWVPPLADRKEDIFLFARARCGQHPPSPRFLLCLLKHTWPGNVGELLDVLDRAAARATQPDEPLTLDHFGDSLGSAVREVRELPEAEAEKEVYRELAGMLQRQGLTKGDGLYRRMADLLKVSRPTVTRRAAKYLTASP
jgi:two-component system NtrC family response regulator